MPKKADTIDGSEASALPVGLLAFYEERQGLRNPEIRIFNPSLTIEDDINSWIARKDDVRVHAIQWLPSQGMLGASVTFSIGGRATESLVLPAPHAARRGGPPDQAPVILGRALVVAGAALAFVAVAMFWLFFPQTWYGLPGALIAADQAVKFTVLAAGLAFVLTFLGLGFVLRARAT